MENPGGDDEVESIGSGGHDDVDTFESGGPVEAEAPAPATRHPRHVAELDDFNTSARDNNEEIDGITRARTRAVNQQSVPGLVATLGPMSASEIVYALVAEQKAGDEIKLPKGLVPELSQSLVAIKKPSNQRTLRFGR